MQPAATFRAGQLIPITICASEYSWCYLTGKALAGFRGGFQGKDFLEVHIPVFQPFSQVIILALDAEYLHDSVVGRVCSPFAQLLFALGFVDHHPV